MSPRERSHIINVYNVRQAALASKIYIEQLVIHPLQISLGYDQTPFNRPREQEKKLVAHYPFLASTKLIAAFDGVCVQLSSFAASDVLDSVCELRECVSVCTCMYAQYVCTVCMHSMYAQYVCTVCMHSMYAQYVCTVCMHSMCAQYVCTV